MPRHFLTFQDISREELFKILDEADRMRADRKRQDQLLANKQIALIFEKPSTRTRVSFEVGVNQLGGTPIVLSGNEIQLKRGESPEDTARVLSRYVDGIMIRTFSHSALEEFARHARVPVINGLSDLYHPCQVLADFQTIRQAQIKLENMKLTFVGDGSSNVCHSLMEAVALSGGKMSVICPPVCRPHPDVIEHCANKGLKVTVSDKWDEMQDTDVVYTDVWVSMGQEGLASQKRSALEAYGLNLQNTEKAKPGHILLHCLPAHKGEEVSADLFEKHAHTIFDQAENRLHAQKALFSLLYANLP